MHWISFPWTAVGSEGLCALESPFILLSFFDIHKYMKKGTESITVQGESLPTITLQ